MNSRQAPLEMLTIGEALRKSAEFLARKEVDSPRLDAELLLAHALDVDRLRLYLDFDKPLTAEEEGRYRELITRRGKHEPVAQLCGRREFMGLEFCVTPAVLTPRPETEHLVEKALEILRDAPVNAGETLEIFDVGAGSGAIAIALVRLAERPVRVTASDISAAALEVARANAERLNVSTAVEWIEADLFGERMGPFDLIVSNPPYIRAQDRESLDADVRDYEPPEALFAGRDGLNVIRRLLAESPQRMKPGAALLIEIGQGQADAVRTLVEENTSLEFIEFIPDLQSIPRVMHCRRSIG
ncbi:peptide chain release factor N(5)-glutamine methyltransferase [Candidatus Sumerlaeota bacterium]|nr:peptide chain release factor N(5)-glutamine methyltransferase [Candidatus Sumerlaeota bacterium]